MVGAGVLSCRKKKLLSLGRPDLNNYKKKSGLEIFFFVTSNYGVWWLHLY